MPVLLPNLSLLSLNQEPTDAKEQKKKPYKGKDRYTPYKTKGELKDKETEEKFNVIFNNCAAYTLKVFAGFADCTYPFGYEYGYSYVPLWKNAPTFCKPLAGTVADLPTEEEQAQIVSVFLEGAPYNVNTFEKLAEQVRSKDFTAFILSVSPNVQKVKWNTTSYHAMVGLIFNDAFGQWGITFGAYPTGAITEGICDMSSNKCSNKVTIVLGDQIEVCAREKFPRQMNVRVRVPGMAIREQLLLELGKLTGTSMDL
jgi:hypothetical protein